MLTIAIGFVLRAAAGAVVIDVPISHWLLILTILLALFLALSKRRHELVAAGRRRDGPPADPRGIQPVPARSDDLGGDGLDAGRLCVLHRQPGDVQKFGTDLLGLTLPFPLYGIFRYLYLVHQKEGGGSPAEMLLTDRPLLVCVALWAVAVAVIIYGPRPFGQLFR